MLHKADKHSEAVIKRVARRHEDEAHGGAWKVAFADFCLALLCLFLVMWLLAARSQERAEEILREAGGRATDDGRGYMPETMGGPRGSLIERNPMPNQTLSETDPTPGQKPAKTRYETPGDLAELARTLERLSEDAGLAGNLQSVVTPYGLRVMLHDTDRQGMFMRGSAVPSERFRRLLRDMGPLFSRIENQMLVVGHTDSAQYAVPPADLGGEASAAYSAFSNWALSSNRAMAARAQLLGGGMPAESILQVVGMADRAPLDTEDSRAGVNRRIELLILTSGQAKAIADMFGMPGQTQPLAPGVKGTEAARAALPDRSALDTLRGLIGRPNGERAQDSSKESGSGAH